MHKLDMRFFYFWRRHSFPEKTDKFLKFYTRLGDGYVWVLIIALLYFFYGQETLLLAIKHAIPVTIVSLVFYWVIKLSVRRKRPFELLKKVSAEVPPLDKYSFPSGHTMNNLAVGFIIFSIAPAIGWIVILMPLTWGLLRVYYGVHWLSDVIGGTILAFLSFWLGKNVYLWIFSGM
ncbi:MAG: phosphatase PAP2 family protein [Fibromonadaceae bacterium]|jgi:undecaprenyl-diphosphatase|nr:phosphatase PAP2 family protein [Fibromonadaceae bacterium]